MEDKINSLIDSLLVKTKAGKALWRESGRYGEYLLPMQDSTITISNTFTSDCEYTLNIYNNIGNSIVNYKINNTNSNYSQIRGLYYAVVDYYNKIDSTLFSIMSQLNSEDVIGG